MAPSCGHRANDIMDEQSHAIVFARAAHEGRIVLEWALFAGREGTSVIVPDPRAGDRCAHVVHALVVPRALEDLVYEDLVVGDLDASWWTALRTEVFVWDAHREVSAHRTLWHAGSYTPCACATAGCERCAGLGWARVGTASEVELGPPGHASLTGTSGSLRALRAALPVGLRRLAITLGEHAG